VGARSGGRCRAAHGLLTGLAAPERPPSGGAPAKQGFDTIFFCKDHAKSTQSFI
jgi:hypothetical protein